MAASDTGGGEKAASPPHHAASPSNVSHLPPSPRLSAYHLQDVPSEPATSTRKDVPSIGKATDDEDTTPTLDASHQPRPPLPTASPLMLPDAALHPQKPADGETESSRLSLSSLYSLGSAIHDRAKGITASGPSSVAESEPECQLLRLIGKPYGHASLLLFLLSTARWPGSWNDDRSVVCINYYFEPSRLSRPLATRRAFQYSAESRTPAGFIDRYPYFSVRSVFTSTPRSDKCRSPHSIPICYRPSQEPDQNAAENK